MMWKAFERWDSNPLCEDWETIDNEGSESN